MKVYIETFGCTLNKFDSLAMSRILVSAGFELVRAPDYADIIIVNTCGVKKQTEDKIISHLKSLSKKYYDKKLIVAGCLPVINRELLLREVEADAFIGPSPGYKILRVIENVLELNRRRGERLVDIWDGGRSPLLPPSSCETGVIEPVGISFGCLDNCSFCATKFARSKLLSQPIEKIIEHIKSAIKVGIKEFHITSPDSGVYGFDLNPRVTIVDLLRRIEEIDGFFFVRLGMMNPRWARKWLDDLIEIFRESKHLFKYMHIPVQTGSDSLLRIMNRSHTVEDYFEVAKALRREVDPRFTIATDIIVGHPGESDEDVEATVKLIKDSKPDVVNISKFFPRPRTKAKLMKQIPTDVVKERSRLITKVAHDVMEERSNLWIGWVGDVLIDEQGPKGNLMGRNYAYRPTAVFNTQLSLGQVLRVRVIKSHVTWLEAIPA